MNIYYCYRPTILQVGYFGGTFQQAMQPYDHHHPQPPPTVDDYVSHHSVLVRMD